jgi:hypothetical protein
MTTPVQNAAQTVAVLDPTAEQELAQLPTIIQVWKQLKEEVINLEQQRKEKKARMKAMEEMILRLMKKHEIGALDLKSSGGRLVYQKQQMKSGLAQGTLLKLLSDHMTSEEKAKQALQYINEHRDTKIRERLKYESIQ